MNARVTKDEYFQWITMKRIQCELKNLSLFSFGSLVNRSDSKYLSWKWSHVQKYKTLHMSSWDFCLIFVFLTTANTCWLQKDCTDFIITAAELINQGRPLLSPVSGTMIYIVNSLWRVEGQPLVAYKWPLSWGWQ